MEDIQMYDRILLVPIDETEVMLVPGLQDIYLR